MTTCVLATPSWPSDSASRVPQETSTVCTYDATSFTYVAELAKDSKYCPCTTSQLREFTISSKGMDMIASSAMRKRLRYGSCFCCVTGEILFHVSEATRLEGCGSCTTTAYRSDAISVPTPCDDHAIYGGQQACTMLSKFTESSPLHRSF